MDRERYISNKDYREGYTDGYMAGKKRIINMARVQINSAMVDLKDLLNALEELSMDEQDGENT